MRDTIFALSSGKPPAGIAVIRISGPQALEIHELFCGSKGQEPRRAALRTLRHPATGALLDRAVTLIFPGPNSVTGDDLVEWQCHGGQAVVRAVANALAELGDTNPAQRRVERTGGSFRVREAQPGEFTRRAFENGRINLNEAEGLADLLSAQTESQRRAALLMAEGHFSRRLDGWRERLLFCSAMVESLLDFSDEDDVADSAAEGQIIAAIRALQADMEAQLAAPSAERLNEGISVVLAGPPNAGKSTLLNALVGRDAAIVSEIAGTTRDRIEVPVDIDGIAFIVTDTAGLAIDTVDVVERIGIDRARQAVETADILLWLGEPGDCPRSDAIRIAAQSDRPDHIIPEGTDIALSAITGDNMGRLREMLLERARAFIPAEGDYALHQRQRDAVGRMAAEMRLAGNEVDLLIVAEHLRAARSEMDRLIGRSGVEDMLGALFSRFCIGK